MSSSLKDAGFPVQLLPVVVESGAVAGHTSSEWYGIPAHTAVGAALGDFQCSVYSCMTDKGDAGIVWIRCLFAYCILCFLNISDLVCEYPQTDYFSYISSATSSNHYILIQRSVCVY